MRNLLFTLILLSIGSAVQAQSRCGQPLNDYQFSRIKGEISSQSSSYAKMIKAKQVMGNYCLTQAQAKHILNFFAEDYERLELAIIVYPNIHDKADIYGMYDSFAYFSTAFRFRDFVEKQNTNPTIRPDPSTISFKSYYYPTADGYQGPSKCPEPIGDAEFMNLAVQLHATTSDHTRHLRAKQFVATRCISTEQAMKFASLLASDDSRFDFLKEAHARIYDLKNYRSAAQVFDNPNQGNAFIVFVEQQSNDQTQQSAPPCAVSEQKLKTTFERLKSESFDDERFEMAKHEVPSSSCWTSKQMLRLIGAFSHSSGKMKMAKFGYGYVKDPEAYYGEVSSAFNFGSDKRALSNYISANKR